MFCFTSFFFFFVSLSNRFLFFQSIYSIERDKCHLFLLGIFDLLVWSLTQILILQGCKALSLVFFICFLFYFLFQVFISKILAKRDCYFLLKEWKIAYICTCINYQIGNPCNWAWFLFQKKIAL